MNRGFSVRRARVLCASLALVAICCIAGVGFESAVHAQEPLMPAGAIEDFHLVSPGKGWLLIKDRLFWTDDNGGSWNDITPAAQSRKITAVFFLDSTNAWVGLADTGPLLSDLVLKRTNDGGVTWQTLPSGKLGHAPDVPLLNAIHMQWLDPRFGWLLIKESTSSSFSAGRLFKTLDGGNSWTELPIPVGDSVYIASANSGWAVGRDGDGLYRTTDGGRTWQRAAIGVDSSANTVLQYGLPKFDSGSNGLIPVLARDAGSNQAQFRLYSTTDGGDSWTLVHGETLRPGSGTVGLLPLDLIDPTHAVVVLPRSIQILRMVDRQTYETLDNPDGLSGSIAKIDMANMAAGWAVSLSRNCQASSGSGSSFTAKAASCTTQTRLLSTTDGGAHWSSIPLPQGMSGLTVQSVGGLAKPQALSGESQALSGTQVFAGQAFDTCVPPTLSAMQEWLNSSPYGVWNIYVGGSNRGCKDANQAAINASFVSQLHQQGWLFIPTWVGLQASCSTLNVYTMSSDPAKAYSQGVAEANSASETVADLGFSHTVIYFDLEYFSSGDAVCLAAAQSFMSGWTAQLHARGNQAGVYGSACGSGLDYYYGIANVPDAIWPAAWIRSGYDGSMSVSGIPCIPDAHWGNHQRIWQYAGDHDELWGTTYINIDSDVLDGIVGMPGADCQNPRPNSDQIGLYSEDNYCGAYSIIGVGDYGDPGALGIATDSVSSIKVGKNVEAVLCADAGYLGTCQDFTGNSWSLANSIVGDNQVSSARVAKRLVLISPANAASVLSLRPSFDWADVPGASVYNVQISRNSAFTDLVTNINVTPSAYNASADLPANVWLYWRARPQVAGMWRAWSVTARLKTPNPPSVPVLSAPANNTLTRNYRPLLDWKDSTLPAGTTFDHYRVQVDDSSNFSSPIIDATTAVGNSNASSYVPPSRLAANTAYYWRVRAYNTLGEYSSWSAKWGFRTALAPPVLTAPSKGAQLPNKRPTFSWGTVSGATGYHIQVSRDGAFPQVTWDAACVKTSCAPPADLPAATLLFWRVSTNGTNGPSAWSSTWSFTTANPPSIPVLISPANNALVKSYRPRLDWNNSSVPAGTTFHNYQIQIAQDAAFSSMYVQADVNGDATASQFTLPAGHSLKPDKTYYWRVRAYNKAFQYSSWSSTWKVRTAIVPPTLLTPANNSTITMARPLLDWGDVSGATQYTVQISATPDFTSNYIQDSPTASQFTPAVDLPAGAVYWRVMALGPNGPSNWSAAWSFTIQ
ncbi:MAG TPA: glycoside hydrolase domain-containing protein [Anaerolineales bacterium]|nr:glycoside hydrolase domain-containing protein [Anaerolineales bacterium]